MPLIRVCAITCDCYPDDPLVRRTAEAAASAGYEYHVICSMRDGQMKHEVFNGVHVHRIRIPSKKGKPLGRITARPLGVMLMLWTLFAFLVFQKVARLHLGLRFDVIHVHNLPDYLVFSALVPRILRAKVILEVQDVAPELMAAKSKGIYRTITVALAKWQERLSTAFADHVLTVGWPFEQPLLKRGVRPEKLSSVLNSADPNIFQERKRSAPFLGEATAERPIIVMYHGTLAERNGLDVAIRAIAKARTAAPHLRLYVKGGGEAQPYLKQLAQALHITDHVAFLPSGPLEEVADFIAHGDIGIIPYRSDGFMDLVLPTKAYEFAWMRRPIIASDILATRTMFGPDSIRLCEPSNADSFAEAIIDLYWHPEKRAELVAGAERDYVKYRWELMAERYCRLIDSMAQKQIRQTKSKTSFEVTGPNG